VRKLKQAWCNGQGSVSDVDQTVRAGACNARKVAAERERCVGLDVHAGSRSSAIDAADKPSRQPASPFESKSAALFQIGLIALPSLP